MTPDVARAIWVSAGVALAIQVVAFFITRSFRGGKVMVGWGLGTLLRLASLLIYGLIAGPILGFPLAPALLTMAATFLITTLFEPFLLSK